MIDLIDKIRAAKENRHARNVNNIFHKPDFTGKTYPEELDNIIASIYLSGSIYNLSIDNERILL